MITRVVLLLGLMVTACSPANAAFQLDGRYQDNDGDLIADIPTDPAQLVDPSTLIFDEATSALDTLTEAAVMSAITRMAGQKTIIMIAHRLTTVQHCDSIFLLRHGKVAASGTFKELVAENEEFRRMATGIDADAV